MSAGRALGTAGPRAILAGVALGACLLASVCGYGENADRIGISGVVRLDGQPLKAGHLTLRPLGEGSAVTGEIADGRFELSAHEGPARGKYIVEIDSVQPTGRLVENPDLHGTQQEEMTNIIPRQFNRDSKLQFEVVAEGANPFEFDVRSR